MRAPPDTANGAVSPGARSALAEPLFRRYFLAMCLSNMGTWISRFLLGWTAWDLTHAATWVGITSTLLLLPTFILSPLFGVVSDRVSPRNGMLATLASQGALVALTALTLAGGWFSLGWLLFLALGMGSVTAAHQPLRLALIPRLVERDALPSAIGISAITFNLSRILGPAAAGWLLLHASPATAFACAAALFAGALSALLRVHSIGIAGDAGQGSVLAQLAEGLRFARDHPTIRLILAVTLVNGLLGRTVIELLPALSGKLLDGAATTLALLTACAGAGSVLGGFLLTRHRSDEAALLHMMLYSLLGATLVLLPLHWANGLWAIAGIALLLSMATTMAGAGSQALAQLTVSDQYRGRVLSIWTVFTMGAPAIGSLVMGALADLFGFVAVVTGFATLALLCVGSLWRQRREL